MIIITRKETYMDRYYRLKRSPSVSTDGFLMRPKSMSIFSQNLAKQWRGNCAKKMKEHTDGVVDCYYIYTDEVRNGNVVADNIFMF